MNLFDQHHFHSSTLRQKFYFRMLQIIDLSFHVIRGFRTNLLLVNKNYHIKAARKPLES